MKAALLYSMNMEGDLNLIVGLQPSIICAKYNRSLYRLSLYHGDCTSTQVLVSVL